MSSAPPSAMTTSGPPSESTRTRPTPIRTLARLRWSRRRQHPRVIAIGECGLDYYYDKSDRAAQRERFQAHIEAARTTGLPLVVHTRDAEDDTAEILSREVGKGGVTGVLHCFTGSAELARKALDLGFYISISGIVTFKNARDLQDTAKTIPQDRLLVETDSPFLAPVPHRGQTCEPAFVADTAAFLSELRERAARRAGRSDHRQLLPTVQQGAA